MGVLMSKNPFAITLDPKLSLNNKTGSWRNKKPVYVKRMPPCNMTCPAGNNVQAWLSKVQEGDIRGAWEEVLKNNPFPAVIGRVCYHPCEVVCNRNHLDASVNINLVEKYIGDFAIKNNWKFDFSSSEQTGKNVLIIGSGPAGLTAAFFLRKCGHNVTVFEEKSKPGGMLRYGIPSYRLSRDVLDSEINRIVDTGVCLQLNKRVSDLKEYESKYDAIFVSTGAHVASKSDIQNDGNTVFDAVDLLRKLEDDGRANISLGDNVVVYGGGNTAIDVARTAIRLGCKNVKIVYRRELDQMAAHKTEVEEALQEGVQILCMRSIVSIKPDRVIVDILQLDSDKEYTSSGKMEEITSSSVIFAIGQSVDVGFLKNYDDIEISNKGVVSIDDNFMTGHVGIFAGGDVVPSQRTVTTAIGHGKKAARCIDAFLNGKRYTPCEKNEVITFKKMNFSYYKKVDGKERGLFTNNSFDEYGINLTDQEALFESQRCMSCGNCMSCDNCYGMCPDGAIKKDNFGLTIDYDYCKGCGICAKECPCGSIKMVEEDK